MKIGVSEHDQESEINIRDKGEYFEVQLTDCEEEIYWKFPKTDDGFAKANNVYEIFQRFWIQMGRIQRGR